MQGAVLQDIKVLWNALKTIINFLSSSTIFSFPFYCGFVCLSNPPANSLSVLLVACLSFYFFVEFQEKNSYLFLNKNVLPLSHFSCFIDSCNIYFLFLFSDL